jgi:hypothetical protein
LNPISLNSLIIAGGCEDKNCKENLLLQGFTSATSVRTQAKPGSVDCQAQEGEQYPAADLP